MLSHAAKRFYKQVSVGKENDEFAVYLDQRILRTPARKPLHLPNLALAEAIAADWEAQEENIIPATMPLMQLASTAIDCIPVHRDVVLEEMLRYAGTDLLCYRATDPSDLIELQERQWQPLLDWAAETLGATLVITQGVIAIPQPSDALDALCRHIEQLDIWKLTAAQSLTVACGSVILALATVAGRINAEETADLAFLDELYQSQHWGEDEEAIERRENLRRDILAAEYLVLLSRPSTK